MGAARLARLKSSDFQQAGELAAARLAAVLPFAKARRPAAAQALQYRPLLWGTLVFGNLQAAFLSPPVAMSAFYLKGVAPKHVTLKQIFSGMMPYMVILIICMIIMYFWPGMTLVAAQLPLRRMRIGRGSALRVILLIGRAEYPGNLLPWMRLDTIAFTATQAAAEIARGIISAEDYTRACLDHIAAVEGEVRAFIHLDPEHALAQARALDRHKREGGRLGPLHGVPVAIKDIFDTADYPTEYGSPAARRPPSGCGFDRRR